MCRNLIAGMGFAHVDEEELHVVAGIVFIQIAQSADGTRGHGAGRGAERQHYVLASCVVGQPDEITIDGAAFKFRRSIARSWPREPGVPGQQFPSGRVTREAPIVVWLCAEHDVSPSRAIIRHSRANELAPTRNRNANRKRKAERNTKMLFLVAPLLNNAPHCRSASNPESHYEPRP